MQEPRSLAFQNLVPGRGYYDMILPAEDAGNQISSFLDLVHPSSRNK